MLHDFLMTYLLDVYLELVTMILSLNDFPSIKQEEYICHVLTMWSVAVWKYEEILNKTLG